MTDPRPNESSQDKPRRPVWQCEYCGQFYSEQTGAKHAYCQQAMDRENAERAGALDV
jgi:hypothetical protein